MNSQEAFLFRRNGKAYAHAASKMPGCAVRKVHRSMPAENDMATALNT
ncbi:hypothetical protein X772_16335 [Mesorhizobium sp. LSJC280B00]|nr:hypothetical protein X772_16335 [Mesorhizobium sp. LSJC280B00]